VLLRRGAAGVEGGQLFVAAAASIVVRQTRAPRIVSPPPERIATESCYEKTPPQAPSPKKL